MTVLLTNGNVRYHLKTPYRDGTTHVIFEPLDKIAGSDFGVPGTVYLILRIRQVFN